MVRAATAVRAAVMPQCSRVEEPPGAYVSGHEVQLLSSGLAFNCLSMDSGFRRKYEPNTSSSCLAVDTWSTTYHGPVRPSVDVNEIGLRHVAEPGVNSDSRRHVSAVFNCLSVNHA